MTEKREELTEVIFGPVILGNQERRIFFWHKLQYHAMKTAKNREKEDFIWNTSSPINCIILGKAPRLGQSHEMQVCIIKKKVPLSKDCSIFFPWCSTVLRAMPRLIYNFTNVCRIREWVNELQFLHLQIDKIMFIHKGCYNNQMTYGNTSKIITGM